jgi:hypothetical protein
MVRLGKQTQAVFHSEMLCAIEFFKKQRTELGKVFSGGKKPRMPRYSSKGVGVVVIDLPRIESLCLVGYGKQAFLAGGRLSRASASSWCNALCFKGRPQSVKASGVKLSWLENQVFGQIVQAASLEVLQQKAEQ